MEMTPEESTTIFLALLESGHLLLGDRTTLHVFDDTRLASTLLVRQVFEEAATFERLI
jgi:hypothetical protein